MGDRQWPLNRLLDIVGRPGVYQTITVLRQRGDVLTFAEIDAEVHPHAERCLRTLAAEGFVNRSEGGSWDDGVDAATLFVLTAAGAELLTRLRALEAWAAQFSRRTVPPRHQNT